MPTTFVVGAVAVIFSAAAVFVMSAFIPVLWSKGSTISDKLLKDMEDFNVLAEGAWQGIMVFRKDVPKVRIAREGALICSKFCKLIFILMLIVSLLQDATIRIFARQDSLAFLVITELTGKIGSSFLP